MQLNPALSFCEVQGRHVFLDLERDRYFCLAGGLEAAWLAVLAAAAQPHDIEALAIRGMIAPGPGSPFAPCPPESPARGLAVQPGEPRSSPMRLLALASAVLWARRQLHRRGLGAAADALARARRKAKRRRGGDNGDLAAIAGDMMRLGLLMTAHNQCLPRSLALAGNLARRGYGAELVIAVRLGPFRAHCWVECDGFLVAERPERVRHYTPIRRL